MGKKLKWFTISFGVIVLLLGLALMFINPTVVGQLPEGFFSPIIALEFMKDTTDLQRFFDVPNADIIKSEFYLGNQVDFIFPFAYSIFIMLCSRLMYVETKAKALWFVIPIGSLVIYSDIFENLNIAEILTMQQYQNAGLILEQLQIYTWLKWGGLSAIMLILSMYFFQGFWLKKILGLFLFASFGLAIPAVLLGGIYCEIIALMIMTCFIGLFIFACTWRPVVRETLDT